MEKKVAVVIVNYNGLSDTVDCINSLKQCADLAKIIVVDNASKKNESIVIAEKFPDAKVLRLNENLGFAGGNNVGIKWALDEEYEYIALLNNDTVVDKDMFALLINSADEHNVVAPYMYYFSQPNSLWYGGGYINRWTGNAKHFCHPRCNMRSFKCSFVTGCCFVAHRNIWEKVGLLDDSYFMYCEDTDYCIRLFQKGVNIKIVPQAKLWHKVGKSSGGLKTAFTIYYVTRNRLLVINRYRFFFKSTAWVFSIITRILRMFLLKLKGVREWSAYYSGIKDAQNNVVGASFKKD